MTVFLLQTDVLPSKTQVKTISTQGVEPQDRNRHGTGSIFNLPHQRGCMTSAAKGWFDV